MKPLNELNDEYELNERKIYGVTLSDTYSLDSYLSRVIGNGLVLLSENFTGVPVVFSDDPIELISQKWKNELRQYGEIFIKYSLRDQYISEIHDSINWPSESDHEWFEDDDEDFSVMKFPDPETEYGSAWEEYTKKTEEFQITLDKELNQALKWFSKYFQSLWD